MTGTNQARGERFHAFDAMRASMMLLGIALHSATAYSTFPDVWWLKDSATSRFADLFILFIHAFRLPAFFVMSGFFAALLLARRGWQGFLENRVARLGLPFLLGMLAMYPVLRVASVYCHFLTRDAAPWGRVMGWLAQGRLEKSIEPMHLWFLEVLMWVCLAAAAAAPHLNRMLSRPWFAKVMGGWLGMLFWSGLTFLTLLPMDLGILDTPHGFAPHFRVLAAYAVFFCFGWGMYCHRDKLSLLRRTPLGVFIAALLCAVLTAMAVDRQIAVRPARDWPAFLATAALTAITAWLMILGLIAVFLRRCSAPSPRMRYLSDSAYWLYLFHPPVLVAVQIPMMLLNWPAAVKFLAGIAVATPLLLVTYDRWVRPTWLGVILNGRRSPRGLPGREPALGAAVPAPAEA